MDRRTFLAAGVATAAFGAEALAQRADHLGLGTALSVVVLAGSMVLVSGRRP